MARRGPDGIVEAIAEEMGISLKDAMQHCLSLADEGLLEPTIDQMMTEENHIRKAVDISRLERVLVAVSQTEFRQIGGYGEPQYLAVLEGESRQEHLPIIDWKSDNETKDSVDPIYGKVQGDMAHGGEWTEPVVGIGLPYQRDFRYAYIYDGALDEVTPEDVYVREIHARDVNLEVICAHPDVKMVKLW